MARPRFSERKARLSEWNSAAGKPHVVDGSRKGERYTTRKRRTFRLEPIFIATYMNYPSENPPTKNPQTVGLLSIVPESLCRPTQY